jgi:hypothetical protein
MRLRAVVVAAVASCGPGGKTAAVVAPTPGSVLAKFPVGPPLITPGERFSYKVQLQGIDLATYDFVVNDEVDLAGKRAILVQSHAKAVGLVSVVANVDDSFASWIDVTTGRPLRWQTDEFATKRSDKERTDVRFIERAGNVVPVDFHLNDEPPTPEPQTVSLDDVWDFNALLVELRSWEAPPGTTVEAEVFRSRYLWHLTMVMHGGHDAITTDVGDLPAHRLDGHVAKVDRKNVKLAGDDERDFKVWISDDDGRVPLKVTAKTDYGDVILTLTAYDPGAGKRLRN